MRKLLALASTAVVAGSLGVAALFASSAPSFAPARSYAVGRAPDSVAIADLNGDAKPDLVTANSLGSSVSVLLNRGGQNFRVKRDYRVGRGPTSVAIGDLNGDGAQDLVSANREAGTVSVLANRGNGSFEAKRDFATGFGPGSVALSDLNGDGKVDLVTANQGEEDDGTVSVLLNSGDGGFGAKRDYGTGGGPESLGLGDLNGDGKPDLVTADSQAGVLSMLLNIGDGSFGAKRARRTGEELSSLAIGDVNGDGKPDIATANNGDYTVSVFANRGDGTFRPKRNYPTGYAPVSIALGDVSGDGKPDLATANTEAEAPTVSVLVNRGGGRFRANIDYRTRRFSTSVAIGDLNGDGKLDLAAANIASRSVSVLYNKPGLCTVQNVVLKRPTIAKQAIVRANCRVGTIRGAYSNFAEGFVISQKPRPGTVLPGGSKVNLVLSRGRNRS